MLKWEIYRMIEIKHLNKTFSLKGRSVDAVRDVSLTVQDGDIYGVIGYSGAGKSTLVRCINLLETPDSGTLRVNDSELITVENGKILYGEGKAPMKEKQLNAMRRSIGMIFQHFNLLDRSTVFENVAYPLKYSGMSKRDIQNRVMEMLQLVDLTEKRDAYPSQLSGGQKQRVAIAGILAMKPRCIVLDEPTAMLDPVGRGEVLDAIIRLNRQEGISVILVTHHMEECIGADRLLIMSGGSIIMDGSPREIFPRVEDMEAAHLGVPDTTRLLYELNREGCSLPLEAVTTEECAQALFRAFGHKE